MPHNISTVDKRSPKCLCPSCFWSPPAVCGSPRPLPKTVRYRIRWPRSSPATWSICRRTKTVYARLSPQCRAMPCKATPCTKACSKNPSSTNRVPVKPTPTPPPTSSLLTSTTMYLQPRWKRPSPPRVLLILCVTFGLCYRGRWPSAPASVTPLPPPALSQTVP